MKNRFNHDLIHQEMYEIFRDKDKTQYLQGQKLYEQYVPAYHMACGVKAKELEARHREYNSTRPGFWKRLVTLDWF